MSAPRTIADLLARDLTKGKIEEIAKVDQVAECSAGPNLNESSTADRLRKYAPSPSDAALSYQRYLDISRDLRA
jgi:hypothetical protein